MGKSCTQDEIKLSPNTIGLATIV